MPKLLTAAELAALIANTLTVGDAVNITGATNATPIVVTATAHGLETGDWCLIESVGGNTNANGIRQFTKVNANSGSIGVAGNDDHSGGGTIKKITIAKLVRDLKPAEVESLMDQLNRRAFVRGTDAAFTAEPTLATILG